ncbi:MAG: DUF6883 domain-containing protein [Thermomicrobiales bacterium]
MKVQNAASAGISERKITGYLLNRTHEKGGPKARFFLGHGYTLEEWRRLANDLRRHVRTHEITESRPTWKGTNYEVTGELTMPDGTTALVVTVWYIVDGGTRPQLVTAHPAT